MNNLYASIFFLQKSQFKAALPVVSPNFKFGKAAAQLKKGSFISNSSQLETNILFAYQLVEANLFIIGRPKQFQVSLNPLVKAFISFSGFSWIKAFAKPTSVDSFFIFFSSQVFYTATYLPSTIRLVFTPRSVFFFSNYFSLFSNSYSKNNLGLTLTDRLLYAELISSFFQTGTFFSGNYGSVVPLFSLFAVRHFANTAPKSGLMFSKIKLLSSTFSRRYIARNSRFSQPLKYSSQAFCATKVVSFLREITKRAIFLKGATAGLPFFYRRYFQVSLASGKGVKRSKKAKKPVISAYNQSKVQKANQQTVYFKLLPSIAQEDYINLKVFSQLKHLLSSVTNARFSLYLINALSLARFAFDQERHRDAKSKGALARKRDTKENRFSKVKLSQRFLFSLERERASRFRYVGVFIQDLIRVSFFARYLKKVNFLAFFYAFTLSKLPRNRKETKFLRFIRKLVKVFASQREERVGVRIRFQGRVNR